MAYQKILYETKGGVATITLNRPEKVNALDFGPTGICYEILHASEEAANDPEVKVVVVKGAGRGFSSGYDIAEAAVGAEAATPGAKPWQLKKGSEKLPNEYMELERSLRLIWINAIWVNPKPFIAQVHGFCLAGGMDLANICDIIICSDDAIFGYPAVRYGSMAVTPSWWLQVGLHKAKEMVLTGNLFTAKEMYDFGMVNRVVPRDKLEEEVSKLVDDMLKMPVPGQHLNKLAVNDFFDVLGLQSALEHVNVIGAIVQTSRDEFGREFRRIVEEKGLKAALELRDAKFEDKVGRESRERRYDITK